MSTLDLGIQSLDELSELEKLGLQDFSYSRISTFEWCEAQYFYKYIIKVPDEYGDKALLGNMLHKAIEITEMGGEKLDKSELVANYEAARYEYDPEFRVVSDELFETGFEMLDMYVARKDGKPSTLTVAEEYFEFAFAGVLFRGYIDQVFIYDDYIQITDLKTGAWRVPKSELPTYLQLGIYALWMKYKHPDKEIRSSLYYLKHDEIRAHRYTDEDLLAIRDKLRGTINHIRNKLNFHPQPVAWKCKMCAYSKDGICGIGQNTVVKNSKMLKYESEY